MKHNCRIRQYKTVPNIGAFSKYETKHPDRIFSLVTDESEVSHIFDMLGYHPYTELHSLFVSIDEGDYNEIWGFWGSVPYNEKSIYRIL